jgi:hypothetical protein
MTVVKQCQNKAKEKASLPRGVIGATVLNNIYLFFGQIWYNCKVGQLIVLYIIYKLHLATTVIITMGGRESIIVNCKMI